jgi:ribosomal protein S27AE
VAKKKPSARNERRASERDAEKLARDREKLARLEAGGAPERPIDVDSASIIEPHALSMRCLRCDSASRLVDHTAETVGGTRLRAVRLSCGRCGAKRTVWFRIAMPS